MDKNKATWIYVGLGILVLGGLFAYPRFKNSSPGSVSSDVPCLVPNVPLVQHIHPHLTIIVDNTEETIPANLGLGACEKALHTHDATGQLHVEAQDSREYTLGDFFSVWGKSVLRDGYSLEVTSDDQPVQNPELLQLKDEQHTMMKYTKL